MVEWSAMTHVSTALRATGAAFAALAAASVLSGCGPGARIERLRDGGGPLAEAAGKARAAQLAGRVDEARGIYEEIAVARPSDAEARLQLGILLHDLAKDPYGALCEYRAYLKLAPDSQKAEMVRMRARDARDQIARRAASGGDADSAPGLPGTEEQQRRIAELESALADARSEAQLAAAELEKARSDVNRLQRDILSKDRRIDALQRTGISKPPSGDLSRAADEAFANDLAAAAAAAAEGAPSFLPGPSTYKVKRGDTLWTVAQKAYGDASRMADIRAANRDALGGSDRLVEGMILTLPPY